MLSFFCCQFMSISCQSLSIIYVLCQFMSILCQLMSILCQFYVNNLKHVILSIHVNLCQSCQLIIDKTFLCQSLSIHVNPCQSLSMQSQSICNIHHIFSKSILLCLQIITLIPIPYISNVFPILNIKNVLSNANSPPFYVHIINNKIII